MQRGLGAHPRFHVHSTPPYASWLNQGEIWFNLITQRAIPRGTFRASGTGRAPRFFLFDCSQVLVELIEPELPETSLLAEPGFGGPEPSRDDSKRSNAPAFR